MSRAKRDKLPEFIRTHLFACPKIEGVPQSDDDKLFHDTKYYDLVREKVIKKSM